MKSALLTAVSVAVCMLAMFVGWYYFVPLPEKSVPPSLFDSISTETPAKETADGKDEADALYPALYICHGGGPLPLLGDKGHEALLASWREHVRDIVAKHGRPKAIAVVSAHYSTRVAEVGAKLVPGMDYDYGGFPPESYRLRYPAPGDPALARRMAAALHRAGVFAVANDARDFDHGVFVPLMAMFPDADIPVVPVSVLHSESPGEHVAMGKALRAFRREGVLFLGSGASMHNFLLMGVSGAGTRFGNALTAVLANAALSDAERVRRMLSVDTFDGFTEAQPRRAQEHLMPLFTILGTANGTAAREIANVRWMAVNARHYLFEH